MSKKILIPLFTICLLASCGDDSASNANNENGGSNLPPQQGTEIPCDAGNEGLEIKPADSENPRLCTNGTWVEILSSSSAPTEDLSSSSANPGQAGNEVQSSSSVTQNSSSSDIPKSSSSTILSEVEGSSSSSEESKMYLCDDGETYVLDLTNCANSSSSSSKTPDPAEESSSSTPILSSSSTPIEDPCSSSSSVVSSSSSAVSSSSVQSSSSSVMASSSSSSVAKSSSSVNVSSSSISSSSMMLNSTYDATNNTLTDIRDGHVYKTVTIGTQIWMAENLNYLPEDTVGTVWRRRSVCGGGEYLSLQEGDCSIYGRLYEVTLPDYSRYNINVCPDGWSIPTPKQWNVLVEFMGGSDIAGKMMKSDEKPYWPDENLTNEYGFSALPAGYFNRLFGFNYRGADEKAVFTVRKSNSSERNGIIIPETEESIYYTDFGETYFLAVRCIKD